MFPLLYHLMRYAMAKQEENENVLLAQGLLLPSVVARRFEGRDLRGGIGPLGLPRWVTFGLKLPLQIQQDGGNEKPRRFGRGLLT